MKHPTRTAQEQFDRQATHYDERWVSWSAETLNWIVEASQCQPTNTALDVATGSGFTAIELAGRVASVVGSDVSQGMLSEARLRAAQRGATNVVFIEAFAESLPFEGASFDIVACRIAAHHFVSVEKFVAEAYRVMKPGGRFVLVDTTVPDDSETASQWQNAVEAVRDTSHVRNYPPKEWRRFAEGAGFRVVELRDSNGGITIPLNEWITKAGCSPEQEQDVRDRFASAPDAAREAFKIHTIDDGATIFTWRRVLLKALKPEA